MTMEEAPLQKMQKFGGFWKKNGRNGSYLSGSFSPCQTMMIFPNGYKKGENDPDYIAYTMPKQKRTTDDFAQSQQMPEQQYREQQAQEQQQYQEQPQLSQQQQLKQPEPAPAPPVNPPQHQPANPQNLQAPGRPPMFTPNTPDQPTKQPLTQAQLEDIPF